MNYFLDEIKRIIDLPKEEVNVEEAALLLLKMNRNKVLHKNIVRRNLVDKVLHELNKIYSTHAQSHLLEKTAEMEVKVSSVLENNPELNDEHDVEEKIEKGKRPDHDQLPEEIQAYYIENLNIFRRMRKTHEQLKLMADQRPCDRYPFLCELLDLDEELRGNWHYYDNYIIGTPIVTKVVDDGKIPGNDTPDPKKVSAARKYLSENKKKLPDLTGDARTELLAKMQERYDYLANTGSGISDQQKEEYKAFGLNV